MTTDEVVCLEPTLQVIEWYCWRWRIEPLFAPIKQKGLNVEASQMESISAIQRLTVLALSVAIRTLQRVEGRDNLAISASIVFSEAQQQCLSQMAPSLTRKTKKQQNPHAPSPLPWAVWLIARMGGWSGYNTQRPPGVPTLVRGLRQFEATFMGWEMALGGLMYTR